jgi:hypothetical protein
MKTDMLSEMHNISTVTSYCFADFILGRISETSLNIPAYPTFTKSILCFIIRSSSIYMYLLPRTKLRPNFDIFQSQHPAFLTSTTVIFRGNCAFLDTKPRTSEGDRTEEPPTLPESRSRHNYVACGVHWL